MVKHDIKKKHNFWLKRLFRSRSSYIKKDNAKITISSLRKLVRTKEQGDILKLIENETIPSVRDAWIDYFLEKTQSPKLKKSD